MIKEAKFESDMNELHEWFDNSELSALLHIHSTYRFVQSFIVFEDV